MEKLFDPLEVKKEEFYKKRILKPEEDVNFTLFNKFIKVDGFGNKGYFKMED